MKNRIKRSTKKIKRSLDAESLMQRELHSQSQEGNGSTKMSKWHGGKGSKRRPEDSNAYADAWERIWGKPLKVKTQKKTPKHGLTQVHKDKSKYNRKVSKQELQKDDFQ
tara:strand:- start:1804 stop:2130 length:327 start_codon:yes stop_codon:yes gene_type:complete